MRKRLITPIPLAGTPNDEGWLDLDRAAVVEVTSEEKQYPVESALVSGEMRGWRAADSGTQTILLIFDEPQRLGSSAGIVSLQGAGLWTSPIGITIDPVKITLASRFGTVTNRCQAESFRDGSTEPSSTGGSRCDTSEVVEPSKVSEQVRGAY
jgi:hypothetical protein